jgi:hypothetical protein
MARTLDIGQEHELLEKLEAAGLNSAQTQAVIASPDNNLAKRLVSWLAGALRVVFTLAVKVERDMTDWTCPATVAGEGEFEPVLSEFLNPGEPYVGGEEMVKRATKQGALSGLRHAEAMLRQQEKIPVEWRKYCLVFPEVWVLPDGSRRVWYLYWDGRQWVLYCYWLHDDFCSGYRLVSPASVKALGA